MQNQLSRRGITRSILSVIAFLVIRSYGMSGGFGLKFSSYPFITTGSPHGHKPMNFFSRLYIFIHPCCGTCYLTRDTKISSWNPASLIIIDRPSIEAMNNDISINIIYSYFMGKIS